MRTLRIASVFVPPLLAGVIAFRAGGDRHLDIIGFLVFLWTVMSVAVVLRFREARTMARTFAQRPDTWQHLDVLTGSGRAMMWLGVAAIVAAVMTGWASFSVIGVLGLGTACVAVTWTTIAAGGDLPWRAAKIERAILPLRCTEGDQLREEIHLSGVRIPSGMRLFVQGRPLRHGLTTRYVVGSDGSCAEVALESELGPAPRGEHHAPPLALWLGDVLGLARTPMVHHGEATFSAVPRPSRVDGARRLLGDGGDDALSAPTHRMPTEGSFRIREYAPGDDMRRIHWVRSLQMNELVVRLPDEIPQSEPQVRLVLDNCLDGVDVLTCTAQDELLDAMVRVWLGLGNALAEAGTRVTMVTSIRKGEAFGTIERPLGARSSRATLQLGARVAWQGTLPLAAMLAKSGKQIVISCRPRRSEGTPELTWVVVPELAWTSPGAWPIAAASWLSLPYPSGSAENRGARRRRERKRVMAMWDDRSRFSEAVGWIDWRSYAGSFIARPNEGRVALEVVR